VASTRPRDKAAAKGGVDVCRRLDNAGNVMAAISQYARTARISASGNSHTYVYLYIHARMQGLHQLIVSCEMSRVESNSVQFQSAAEEGVIVDVRNSRRMPGLALADEGSFASTKVPHIIFTAS